MNKHNEKKKKKYNKIKWNQTFNSLFQSGGVNEFDPRHLQK